MNKDKLEPGDWIKTRLYDRAVCIFVRDGFIDFRHEIRGSKGPLWMRSSADEDHCYYLGPPDAVSKAVQALTGQCTALVEEPKEKAKDIRRGQEKPKMPKSPQTLRLRPPFANILHRCRFPSEYTQLIEKKGPLWEQGDFDVEIPVSPHGMQPSDLPTITLVQVTKMIGDALPLGWTGQPPTISMEWVCGDIHVVLWLDGSIDGRTSRTTLAVISPTGYTVKKAGA